MFQLWASSLLISRRVPWTASLKIFFLIIGHGLLLFLTSQTTTSQIKSKENNPCSGNTCSKEGHEHFICKEGDGLSFFRFKKALYSLSLKGPNHQWRVPCWFAKEATKGYKDQMFRKTDKKDLGFIKTMLQHKFLLSIDALCECGFWTSWSPSLFPCFGPIWLSAVPKHEKKTHLDRNQYCSDDESFSISGIQTLQHWWEQWVDRKGDCVEDKPHLVTFQDSILVSLWTFQLTLMV